MPLPKVVAAAACIGVLGAQLAVATPLAPDRSWYWPFLPYPMYARAHAQSDTLVVPELRVSECADTRAEVALPARELGAPLRQVTTLLATIARAPNTLAADSARGRLSRAIEAQYPARYCKASAWVRTVRVSDPETYGLAAPMHRAASWTVSDKSSR
jgi:hypothetical protein